MWQKLRNQGGYTLMEMLVGMAIIALVIGVVADMEIATYRDKAAYDDAFVKYSDASTALDWIARDFRRSAGTPTISNGGATISFAITNPDATQSTILYQFAAGVVTRKVGGNPAKVLANNVKSLSFSSDSAYQIHVQLQVSVNGGGNYLFDNHIDTRTLLKPST